MKPNFISAGCLSLGGFQSISHRKRKETPYMELSLGINNLNDYRRRNKHTHIPQKPLVLVAFGSLFWRCDTCVTDVHLVNSGV